MFYLRGAGDVPYFPLVQQLPSLPEGLEGFPLSASAKREFLIFYFFFSPLARGGFQGQTKCAGLGFDGWHHLQLPLQRRYGL